MAKTPTDIRSLARSHTEKALNVLAGVMMQEDAPPSARVSAATALLDRGWGKPAQTIDATINDNREIRDLSGSELAARVAAALARIEAIAGGDSGAGTGEDVPADIRQLN